MTTSTQFKWRGNSQRQKRTDRQCYDCGYFFTTKVEYMLHCEFHRGEPTVREVGCTCGEMYDVRMGYCTYCNRIHSAGWALNANN